MSTYWYLECMEHDPPIQSGEEVEQHTSGLEPIRQLATKRATLADDLAKLGLGTYDLSGYFERHAGNFLVQHPRCRMRLVSEYGDVEDLPDVEPVPTPYGVAVVEYALRRAAAEVLAEGKPARRYLRRIRARLRPRDGRDG